jgi:hypothetical protein
MSQSFSVSGASPDAGTLPPRTDAACGEARAFLRGAAGFTLVGLILYAGTYAVAEYLVHRSTERNRFFMIRHAPPTHFDDVILGASHAAAFSNGDLNARLEEMTGGKVMNLSIVGGGVVVNRLLLEYFFTRHTASSIIYVVDSFAFQSRTWNEERLQDNRLFARAPIDVALGRLLLRTPAARSMALDYLVGFSKINNPDRLASDVSADEKARVARTYHPVPQIDHQRIAYLYPRPLEASVTDGYLSQFESLIEYARSRGANVVVIKPPLPRRVLQMLPDEERFDSMLKAVLDRHCVEFHDFSSVGNDDRFFYDTDHLNYAGVMNFFRSSMANALKVAGRSGC